MSAQSTALTLRFRHPERTDAPDGPDSPCAQADAGDVSVTGGDLSYIDSDGRLQGATERDRAVRVQIATNLSGDRASQSVARDSNSIGHQMSIRFGPSDPRFESLCAEWIDGVCWIATPITWPNLNITDFEHEGEGYALDYIYPIIPVTVSDEGAEFAHDITLSISWPRGNLRRFITPNTYGPNITWRPFNPDPVPEHWVAGPHFPGDVTAGGPELGWLIDLDFEFAGDMDIQRYAYRVPVKFVLRSEGRDYDLGPDADFTSDDNAWQPQSINGGAVILHSSGGDEDAGLSPALSVTPELFEHAYADGWEGADGYIDMLLYTAWGHCEFTLHGRCPDPDYEPGDGDVTITTPWTTVTITPEHAGTQVITNPRVSRMTRLRSLMDRDEVGRVSVAVVQHVLWYFSRYNTRFNPSTEFWLSRDLDVMDEKGITRTGVYAFEFDASYDGAIRASLTKTEAYTHIYAPDNKRARVTIDSFSASGGDEETWILKVIDTITEIPLEDCDHLSGIDRFICEMSHVLGPKYEYTYRNQVNHVGADARVFIDHNLLEHWHKPKKIDGSPEDTQADETVDEYIIEAGGAALLNIRIDNNPEVKVKVKIEHID